MRRSLLDIGFALPEEEVGERGGVHFRLGEKDAARKEALRACELGTNEGCIRASSL